jgi:hypothetical protein
MSELNKMIVEYEKKASQLAKLSEEMVQLSVKMAQAVPNAAASKPKQVAVPSKPKQANPEVKRMTDAEFLAHGKELGKDTNGIVAGSKFPKAILPLYMGKTLSLVEVAEMLGIQVIRSSDPKQTHISLDFTEPEDAVLDGDAKVVESTQVAVVESKTEE